MRSGGRWPLLVAATTLAVVLLLGGLGQLDAPVRTWTGSLPFQGLQSPPVLAFYKDDKPTENEPVAPDLQEPTVEKLQVPVTKELKVPATEKMETPAVTEKIASKSPGSTDQSQANESPDDYDEILHEKVSFTCVGTRHCSP